MGTDAPKRSLRIAYVVPSLQVGGMEHFVVRLAIAMQARGHNPRVYCTSENGVLASNLEIRGIEVRTIAARHKAEVVLPRRLAGEFRAAGIDVVHTQTGSWTQGILGARLAGVRGRCHTEHGLMSARESGKLVLLKRLALPFTGRTVVVSAQLKRDLAAQLHLADDALQLIPNGIDAAQYRLTATERATARASLGLRDDDVAIAVLARLERIKGVDVLFDAIRRRSTQQWNQTRLFVLGDGSERAALERAALAEALPVEFLGARADVARLLGAFDLVVQPSRAEGLPLALLEAMAAGRCIIATDVGDMPAALQHGSGGVIVPKEDPDALIHSMELLIGDAARRTSLGRAAAERVEQQYSFEKMANDYEELYRELA